MAEPFLGEVRLVGFNFAPEGWVLCNGQLLPISNNDALFNLLGTTYGGDGVQTFGVPDLRGRTPICQGQGQGLTARVLGEMPGTEMVALTPATLPVHQHVVHAFSADGDQAAPTAGWWAAASTGDKQYGPAPGTVALAASALSPTGGDLPHENMMPFQTVSFMIATAGVYPSQG